MRVSLQEGGLLQQGLLPVLGERKSHLFFLSMHLYPFLNVVSCVWMMDVLILAPPRLSLGRFLHVFHLILVGLFLFLKNRVLQLYDLINNAALVNLPSAILIVILLFNYFNHF
jgi:hypothetical protein